MNRRDFTRITASTLSVAMLCATIQPGFAHDAPDVWEDVPSYQELPPFPTLSIEEWIGEKVVFKHASPESQKSFLSGWYEVDDSQPYRGAQHAKRVPYTDLAGKTGTIVEFFPDYERVYVVVELDEMGKRYAGKTKEKSHWSVVFLRDVEAARQALVGKTLWNLAVSMRTDFDDKTRTEELWDLEPITVTAVTPGEFLGQDIRFFLRPPDGREGFKDMYVSRTNIRLDELEDNEIYEHETFEGNFLTDNPRERYPFTPEIWQDIDDYRVTPGMTPLQVVLAYRKPDTVEKPIGGGPRDMVYVYIWNRDGKSNSRRITFQNGRVTDDTREERPVEA